MVKLAPVGVRLWRISHSRIPLRLSNTKQLPGNGRLITVPSCSKPRVRLPMDKHFETSNRLAVPHRAVRPHTGVGLQSLISVYIGRVHPSLPTLRTPKHNSQQRLLEQNITSALDKTLRGIDKVLRFSGGISIYGMVEYICLSGKCQQM